MGRYRINFVIRFESRTSRKKTFLISEKTIWKDDSLVQKAVKNLFLNTLSSCSWLIKKDLDYKFLYILGEATAFGAFCNGWSQEKGSWTFNFEIYNSPKVLYFWSCRTIRRFDDFWNNCVAVRNLCSRLPITESLNELFAFCKYRYVQFGSSLSNLFLAKNYNNDSIKLITVFCKAGINIFTSWLKKCVLLALVLLLTS